LDFSKIEAGGIELEKASFLRAMLGGIQKSMQAKAREQGIEISV
jgi:signal transduction histidine kinase